jgi:heptosyltransferase-2
MIDFLGHYPVSDSRILIIKLGALGDVVRTTPLLRVLQGNITWITSVGAIPLLSGNRYVDHLEAIEARCDSVLNQRFDLVLSLEDELSAASLASSVKTERLIGSYREGGTVTYTQSASEWFDLGLISKFGKQKADELKKNNRRTYQDFIFSMVGHRFRGEEYVLNTRLTKHPAANLVGLEARAGTVWPMKRWGGYEKLAQRLLKEQFQVKVFRQHPHLTDYIDEINECQYVVCGDTLAMHVGLALGKLVVAIFTCTSPHEIYDYQRMIKIVSPVWEKYFYCRDFVSEAADAVSVETVFDAIKTLGETQSASRMT